MAKDSYRIPAVRQSIDGFIEGTYESLFEETFGLVSEGHCPHCKHRLRGAHCDTCNLDWHAFAGPKAAELICRTPEHNYRWVEEPREAEPFA